MLRHLNNDDQKKYCNTPKKSNMTLNENGKKLLKNLDISNSVEQKTEITQISSDKENKEEEESFLIENMFN